MLFKTLRSHEVTYILIYIDTYIKVKTHRQYFEDLVVRNARLSEILQDNRNIHGFIFLYVLM